MEKNSILKKGTQKDFQGFGPYRNKPFHCTHHNNKEAPIGNVPMGHSSHQAVQNGNSRVHQGLSGSRGMGVVHRPIGHLPSHPHLPNLRKYCNRSQVFQFTSLPFDLATAPQVFTMIVKEVKLMALTRGIRFHQYLDNWLIRAQSQKGAQVNTQTMVDLTQSLGWIINQKTMRTETYPGVFVRGL